MLDVATLEAEIDRQGQEIDRQGKEIATLRAGAKGALGLSREARDYMLMGSAPRAKKAMADVCVLLRAMAGEQP